MNKTSQAVTAMIDNKENVVVPSVEAVAEMLNICLGSSLVNERYHIMPYFIYY